MTDPHKPDSKIDDFMAAALRQKRIEEQVSTQGEDARAALERQAIIDQGGAAAEALLEDEKRRHTAGILRAFAESETGAILDALKRLPADDNGRSFRISTKTGDSLSVSLATTCHYANDTDKYDISGSVKKPVPVLKITLRKYTSDADNIIPRISVDDYTSITQKVSGSYDACKVDPKDAGELRALLGTFIARAAPHRLDEVMALVAPREYAATHKPPALSQDITLSAPALPFDTATGTAPQTGSKKSGLLARFRRNPK